MANTMQGKTNPIKANVPSAGIKKWVRFNMETDADTRGKGSSRTGVEMEPARKAIINVYQLVDLYKKKDTKKSTKKGKGNRRTSSQADRAEDYFERETIPSPYMNGRSVYKDNWDLVQINGENDKDYEIAFMKHRQLVEAARQEEAARSQQRTVEDIKAQQAAGERAMNKAKANSDQRQLIKRLVDERIPFKTKQGEEFRDGRYRSIPLNTLERDDIIAINNAITNAKRDGYRFSDIPSPILGLSTSPNASSIKSIYVLKEIAITPQQQRRKKITHAIIKRPIKKLSKHTTHGNTKRRVVMKKKGGR